MLAGASTTRPDVISAVHDRTGQRDADRCAAASAARRRRSTRLPSALGPPTAHAAVGAGPPQHGRASPRSAGSPWPQGHPPRRPPDDPSAPTLPLPAPPPPSPPIAPGPAGRADLHARVPVPAPRRWQRPGGSPRRARRREPIGTTPRRPPGCVGCGRRPRWWRCSRRPHPSTRRPTKQPGSGRAASSATSARTARSHSHR